MICINCRNEMNPQERYCSKCGRDSLAERVHSSFPTGEHNRDVHQKALAWIFIISSLFVAMPGLFLMGFPGMLARGGPFASFHFAGMVFFGLGLAFTAIPAACIIAGIGLLGHRDWARILALVLSAMMLVAFPFGTAIGIYGFWVLLSAPGRRSYKRSPA